MPKSRHRKNHKKKVEARKKRMQQNRDLFEKKLRDQFGETIAKEIAKQQRQSGQEPENV